MAFSAFFNGLKLRRCSVPINKLLTTCSSIHISKYNLWPYANRRAERAVPKMVSKEQSLKGRSDSLMDTISDTHTVLKSKTKPPFPDNTERIIFGMGCFWGAERMFWKQKGVYSTSVGYAGGYTPNPTYKETCTGQTGHTEVVQVVYNPKQISLASLLTVFFNEHDPTEEMRQGNDVGTQYRSAIFWTTKEQGQMVEIAAETFSKKLPKNLKIETEMKELDTFYYAEDYHQQYLDKNPNGYCGLRGSGYKLDNDFDKKKESDDQKDKSEL